MVADRREPQVEGSDLAGQQDEVVDEGFGTFQEARAAL